jgi:flagellar biosynthesis protein FlhB
LIGGFVKCSLSLFLALKPIVKIPKIISLPALFEIVKVVSKVTVIIVVRRTVVFVRDFVFIVRLGCKSVRAASSGAFRRRV